jgi:membrane-associated phospholipid phosphatase
MRHRVFLSFFLILICESLLLAQNQYNISQFTHETLDFVKQPGNWRGNDWLKLGAIVAGTALVMQVDQPIRDAVLRGKERYYRSVPIEAGRIWGEWYTPPVIAGAFGLHGWLAHNTSSKKIGFELVQASVYSEAITQGLKIVFGRARPYENKGAFYFHPLNISDFGFHSLPGGHNTNGWAMSTVLSRNAHSDALKILAYVPAVLTFVSRVYQDQHWTSDDFLGATIGYLVGSWVVNLHEKKESAVNVSAIYPFTISFKF